jgi:hypothetical protein
MTLLGWLIAGFLMVPGQTPADQDKIDRTLRKEPAYQSKNPRYGLLVFGMEGKTRVWVVFDSVPDPLAPGDAVDYLYVDRNGNGDLTEPGERIAAKVRKEKIFLSFARELAEFTVLDFDVGEITEAGGKVRHKDLKVTVGWFHGTERPVALSLLSHGKWEQWTTRDLILGKTPAAAPVIRLAGPLTMRLSGELPKLAAGASEELYAMIGTQGSGDTFASLRNSVSPAGVHPQVEIVIPARDPARPPIKVTTYLKQRC